MASEQQQQQQPPVKSDPQQQQQQEHPVEQVPLALSKYSKRVLLKAIINRPDGGIGLIGQRVVIGGWVKSSREFKKEPLPIIPAPAHVAEPHKDVTCVEVLQSRLPFFRSIMKVLGGGDHRIRDKFDAIVPKPPQQSISILQISDGSCVSALQVLIDSTLAPPSLVMPTGTCILVEGIMQKPSLQGKQTIEVNTEKILHIGVVDPERYPLSKKRLPLESLRDTTHFRPRTTTVASVVRIRSSLTKATHDFFHENGFLYVQVPIITSTNCGGSRKNFQVTTLLGKEKIESNVDSTDAGGVKLEAIKASIGEKSKQIEELKRNESNREAIAAAIHDLKKTTELVSQLERKQKATTGMSSETKNVNFAEDFFSCQTYLTANGRLHLESYASALGNVYTFGPRFSASRNESKKLLAEMWMVELEMAFSQLEDSMECATDFLKFMCKYLLDNCTEDLDFCAKRVDKFIKDRLHLMAASRFEKVSYTEAVNFLKQVTGKKFEAKVEWGAPLKEEHESYLTDEVYKRPIIIYNHPKELKPFYIRLNDDGRTVASFDVIVPKIGTLVRGSQSEERFNTLNTRIREFGLEKQQYEWYLDLRRHGAVKSSGFSFWFDPLVLYATGLNDIKDAVPFPRSIGKANN